MSLGKRYIPRVRAIIAIPPKLGVSLIDPAVDVEKSDLQAYWDSDFDPKHLSFHEGEVPTRFTLRPLTRRQKDALDVAYGERSSISWYLRCSIVRIENYFVQQQDGSMADAPQPKFDKRGEMGEIASEDWLDEINFPTDLKLALFHIINKISEPSLPLSKRSGPESGAIKSETQGASK